MPLPPAQIQIICAHAVRNGAAAARLLCDLRIY
jgi:hypothetical protein